VIDVEGRVLGVSVPLSPTGRDAGAEWYDSGIGFAATIADIAPLIERMQEGEVLHRGWLGVQMSSQFLGPGAKLAQVPRGGVAHAAGLRKGDIITVVDGVEVLNSFHLQMLVSSRMGGDPVHLKVVKKRDDEPVGMTLFLADTPYEEQAKAAATDLPASFPLPDKDR
jgi:serine protease Do